MTIPSRQKGFRCFISLIKFGIARTTADTAHEIRDGHITRKEGVGLVRRFDGEFPKEHFKVLLEYCDISEEYFNEIIDSWRSPHLWEKIGDDWTLKAPIWK